jgi:hypothetical protein
MTNNDYHGDYTHVSNTMLSVFRKSRKLFYEYYVEKSRPVPEPSDEMILGSMVHCILLEFENFYDQFYHASDCSDRRTKKWKEEKIKADEQGLTCVTNKQFYDAHLLSTAIKQHPIAHRLLFELEGTNEKPILWKDEDWFGLKCKPDKLVSDGRVDVLIMPDIKSSVSSDPYEFSRSIAKYKYHCQIELYQRGVKQKYPGKVVSPCWIVVGKEEPNTVRVFQPSDAMLEAGQIENDETIAALKTCFDTVDWTEPGENEITEIDLPYYARR